MSAERLRAALPTKTTLLRARLGECRLRTATAFLGVDLTRGRDTLGVLRTCGRTAKQLFEHVTLLLRTIISYFMNVYNPAHRQAGIPRTSTYRIVGSFILGYT